MNGAAKWVIIGLIVGWSLTAAGGVWAVASTTASLQADVAANTEAISDHEKRLRVLERMAGDVRWIRKRLEDRR